MMINLLYFCMVLNFSIYKSSSIYVMHLRENINSPNLGLNSKEQLNSVADVANSSGLNYDFVKNSEHVFMTGYFKFLERNNSRIPFGTKHEDVNSVANVFKGNVTTAYPVLTTLSEPPTVQRMLKEAEWKTTCRKLFWLLQRIYKSLRLFEDTSTDLTTARGKNYYKKSFPIIIIAFMMMLAFVIPMGFQFMVMVGGKALLLSQMALIFGLSGAFKKFSFPEFTSYDLPWHRTASEPSANRFDSDVPLRKSTNDRNKYLDSYQPYRNQDDLVYKLPFL